jgi:hypothetical protein
LTPSRHKQEYFAALHRYPSIGNAFQGNVTLHRLGESRHESSSRRSVLGVKGVGNFGNKALAARIRSLFSALNFLASYFTHFDDILLDHVFDRPPKVRVLMQARSVHACHSRAGLDRPVYNDGAQIQCREQRKHRHHSFGHATTSLGDIE